jgi:hypothetical protein
MANPDELELIEQGVEIWNKWMAERFRGSIDLSRANLSHKTLGYVNFEATNLEGTIFNGTNLMMANLKGAILKGANLNGAFLQGADLSYADLSDAIMDDAVMGGTIIGTNDLREVRGLDKVQHTIPSIIGLDTFYRSHGNIPEDFLRGCGVPDEFITYMRSLTTQPLQFYSCFISYSHKDEDFAQRLFSKMRDANLRVWYAPEEMKGGRKLHEQIFSAIQFHDKLLLVLSENSLQSEWVMTEIRRARKTEREEDRRKLFPLRLVDMKAIQEWECFDADSGKDLAVEVREYFIPDFSNWKDHDAFEQAFDRLLRDLKAEESK